MSSNAKHSDWVDYLKETEMFFKKCFLKEEKRFPDGESCIKRYTTKLEEYLKKNQSGIIRTLEEIHNELCVAEFLLQCKNPFFTKILYEPPFPGCNKTIDYVCSLSDSSYHFVDVKTIMPESIDGWGKYLKNKKHIPKNIEVILDQDLMGGEIWHKWFASRGRMLEYALELEEKISKIPFHENSLFTLALCGNGSDWHVSKLEDFVCFYETSNYLYDDAFSDMEKHYIENQGITLTHGISQFAYFKRSFGILETEKVIWDVKPPRQI
jgi:hypothetical protein